MDGWQVPRALKVDERTAGILAAMISARTEGRDKIIGLQEGAVSYVEKPFSRPKSSPRSARSSEGRREHAGRRARRNRAAARRVAPVPVAPDRSGDGLPTLAGVVDELRRLLEDGHPLGVFTLRSTPSGSSRNCGDGRRMTRLVLEFIRGLKIDRGSGAVPDGILCVPPSARTRSFSSWHLDKTRIEESPPSEWLTERAGAPRPVRQEVPRTTPPPPIASATTWAPRPSSPIRRCGWSA